MLIFLTLGQGLINCFNQLCDVCNNKNFFSIQSLSTLFFYLIGKTIKLIHMHVVAMCCLIVSLKLFQTVLHRAINYHHTYNMVNKFESSLCCRHRILQNYVANNKTHSFVLPLHCGIACEFMSN